MVCLSGGEGRIPLHGPVVTVLSGKYDVLGSSLYGSQLYPHIQKEFPPKSY